MEEYESGRSEPEEPEHPIQPERTGGEQSRADVLGALVEQAKFHLEFEEGRLQKDQQRAGWILALNGVLLGLIANQARETLADASALGDVGRVLAAAALGVAAVLAVLSAVCALLSLRAASSWVWDLKAIADLGRDDTQRRPKDYVQGVFLNGLLERIFEERGADPHERALLDEALAPEPDPDSPGVATSDPSSSADRAAESAVRARRKTLSIRKRQGLVRWAFGLLTASLAAIALHVGVFVERTIEHPKCPNAAGSARAVDRSPPASARSVFASVRPLTIAVSRYPRPPGCPGGK